MGFRDQSTPGEGGNVELQDGTSPETMNRVESLARVCKLLAQTSPRPFEGSPPIKMDVVSKPKDNRELVVLTPSRRCDMHVVSIGIYTRAERRAKLERYRAKKNRRTFNKKILYACRKSFADSRPRVGGRFVPLKDTAVSDTSPPKTPPQRVEHISELPQQEMNGKHSSYHLGRSSPSEPYGAHSSTFGGAGYPPAHSHSPVHASRPLHSHPHHSSPSCCNPPFYPQFLSLHDYPHSRPQFSEPPAYSQQPSYHQPPPQQQQGYYSISPSFRPSAHARPPAAPQRLAPPRSPPEEPSASLLLLSLASSSAARAEVF